MSAVRDSLLQVVVMDIVFELPTSAEFNSCGLQTPPCITFHDDDDNDDKTTMRMLTSLLYAHAQDSPGIVINHKAVWLSVTRKYLCEENHFERTWPEVSTPPKVITSDRAPHQHHPKAIYI